MVNVLIYLKSEIDPHQVVRRLLEERIIAKATIDLDNISYEFNDGEHLIDYGVKQENSTIIPPCYIGEDVILINATVGPNVSLGKASHVFDSTIKNSLVQNLTIIRKCHIQEKVN